MIVTTLTIAGIGTVGAAKVLIKRGNRSANTMQITDMRLDGQTTPIGGNAYYTRGAGVCLVGKWITFTYGGSVLFKGEITLATRKTHRGTTVSNAIEAKSGWFFLERIPYVQRWVALATGAEETTLIKSTRVVLNQNASGLAISAWAQVADILTCAKQIYGAGVVNWVDETASAANTSQTRLDEVSLPFDEIRNTTCAQALERVLRYFPDVSVAFNDATKTMAFRPLGLHNAAGYVENYEQQLERNESLSGNIIDGVRIEIEREGSIDGKSYTRIDIQGAGATTGINILNGTLEIAGSESNRSKQRVDVVTEPVGDASEPAWWLAKCPQVFGNAVVADIEITNSTRSGETDKDNYPRITASPIAEIVDAGLLARVETFTCLATIKRRDKFGDVVDTEKNLPVQIEVITTNATTRTYTFTTALSSTSAEPVPDNLAAALLAAHSGDGAALSIVAKLPDSTADFDLADGSAHAWLPEPGDSYAGMIAQTVDIEFPARTMTVAFGPPAHLSIQDMVGMMTGFRSRRSSSMSAKNRMTGEIDSDEINMNLAIPAQSVQSGQGTRERWVVKKESGGSIDSDPELLIDSDNELKPRQVTIYTPTADGSFQARKIWAIVSEGVDDGSPVEPGGEPAPPPPPPPPPCGHPGNEGGGGAGDHPGNDPDESWNDPDHPNNNPDGPGDHPGEAPGDDGFTPECSDYSETGNTE